MSQPGTGEGWTALQAKETLQPYMPSNAIALFVAEIRFGIDDIQRVAESSITDGANDKACDFVYVNREASIAVIAQAGSKENVNRRQCGDAGKAQDLNTAVNWLLTGNTSELPTALAAAAVEIREALTAGDLSTIELWSVHNCSESSTVLREVQKAADAAKAILSQTFDLPEISVIAHEYGSESINDLYTRTRNPILVTDKISLQAEQGFEVSGSDWSVYNTSIPLHQLRDLWIRYGTDLFGPNVRDYLGVRKSASNINHGIKETASDEPENFFVYNNGVTALVHDYQVNDEGSVTVDGLGVVNGAQTTGSIGTLDSSADEPAGRSDTKGTSGARVQIRLVRTEDSRILENIVRFNNTQNKVESSDFRSRDAIQMRLRIQFNAMPGVEYRGGRRGGAQDAIPRTRTLIPDSGAAKALAAFHGQPNLAYNSTGSIWESDRIYAQVFQEALTARHLLFTYALSVAIQDIKRSFREKGEELSTTKQKQLDFLRHRGSIELFQAAVGRCLEILSGETVTDPWRACFGPDKTLAQAVEAWQPTVQLLLPFTPHLAPAADSNLKSAEKVETAIQLFAQQAEFALASNPDAFRDFQGKLEWVS